MSSSAVLAEVGSNLMQPSLEDQKIYNNLVVRAKSLADDGRVPDALKLYRRAFAIYPAPSLQRKIGRIEAYLAETCVKAESASPAPPCHSASGGCHVRSPDVCRPAAAAADTSVSMQRDRITRQPTVERGCAGRGKATSGSNESEAAEQQQQQEEYSRLVAEAREAIEQGDLERALLLYKRAQGIQSGDKLERRIDKIQRYLSEVASAASEPEAEDERRGNECGYGSEAAAPSQLASRANDGRQQRQAANVEMEEQQPDGDMVLLGDGFYLHELLTSKLYGHQKEGVLWLWRLYRQRKGGILADDMGLGKTVQVIAFLSGLFDAQQAKTVLIVMPVSLIVNWQTEFEKWAPGISVYSYHGQTKRERERIISKVARRGGVVITSYGIVVANFQALAEHGGKPLIWDCIILDEGHKIKNPTKTSKGVHAINARCRIVLTGTPVQNNLTEMWALFDFTHHGMLLGSSKTFKTQYEHPITRAREKCATQGEKVLGQEMAESLKRIISPYFLRRTKAEINARSSSSSSSPNAETGSKQKAATMPKLMRKNDLIVWLYLSDVQMKIYKDFTILDSVKELLMSKKSPLTALTILKKICDHPRLLSIKACCELGLVGVEMESGLDENARQAAASQIHSISNEVLVAESGKMVFLVQLLDRLQAEGHRTLVFSQSRKMLDIIEKVMAPRGHKIIRLDGTVKDMQERDNRVQTFQNNRRYNLFLLTTQVGGIGLTLTAASRVVIFDPSWNPATDSQAVDRAFRIGQEQNVVIYRFITCGTVEEKIYRRQVFKDSLTKQATGASKNPMRYFTQLQLRELFQLDDTRSSDTQMQLEQLHAAQRAADPALDEHIAYLHSCDMFGISDHDLMFTVEDVDDEQADVTSAGDGYIKKRVEKAHQLIAAETELQGRMNAVLGKYVPAQFSETKSKVKGDKQEGGDNAGAMEIGGLESVGQLSNLIAGVTLGHPAIRKDATDEAYCGAEMGDDIIEADEENLEVIESIVEIDDDVTDGDDGEVIASDAAGLVADEVAVNSWDAIHISDKDDTVAKNDNTDSADVASGIDGSNASGSPLQGRARLQSEGEIGNSDHELQGVRGTPATTGVSSNSPWCSQSRRQTQSNFTLDLYESPNRTDNEGTGDIAAGHVDGYNIAEVLTDEFVHQLPVEDFTGDQAGGFSDDSYARRKKLNRRSSCLPSLLKKYQPKESLDSDSDVEDLTNGKDTKSLSGSADEVEDEPGDVAWKSSHARAGDCTDTDDDSLEKRRCRQTRTHAIFSDDEGTEAGEETGVPLTDDSQCDHETGGREKELSVDLQCVGKESQPAVQFSYADPAVSDRSLKMTSLTADDTTDHSGASGSDAEISARRHSSSHSEQRDEYIGSEEEDVDGDESSDENDDLAADFDDIMSSDNEQPHDGEQIRQRRRLREQAKQFYIAGDFKKSLLCLLKTLDDQSSERLQVLALRLKQKISI